MGIIEVKNISFSYAKNTSIQKDALKNLSFSVDKGEFLGIIGHTGSGKSTLVQILNGLIRPDTGTVFFNGKDIWENPKKIRKFRFNIGMVFQYPEHQLFEETVYKDIAFGPKNMQLSDDEINTRVLNSIEVVGLKKDLLNKSPFDLSGGEKRRVAIAGVLAMQTDVLILDEPTAGLDPEGKNNLLAQLMSYHSKVNNTIILISHSMEDIANTTNKVLVLNDGEIAMFDSPEVIFSKVEDLEKIGLTPPQITKIMFELKKKGYSFPDGIITVGQAINEISKYLERG